MCAWPSKFKGVAHAHGGPSPFAYNVIRICTVWPLKHRLFAPYLLGQCENLINNIKHKGNHKYHLL
jgi:hypothetical protein